jgi:hypothetical protein
MDQARKPLSAVLYELAATVAAEFKLPSPAEADFAKGDYFRENILPSLYQSLDNDFRPVFLFDEFDVLTQLICQLLFDRAYAESPSDAPTIDRADVEAVVPKALESGENIFEWIWDGLPPAERVIFSAIAGATDENAVIAEDELTNILQRHGIRILIRELELAPKTLREWEMLRRVDGGYGFLIELMRCWVAERKTLPKVKDEID